MAFTERYVTQAAGGGGDGTSGNPWTLAEGLTHGTAGDRVNIQSDAGYSLGADSFSGSGTITQMLVFRGYNTTIGDLEGQGYNADGSLDLTNYPVITLTGVLDWAGSVNKYLLVQNLSFTGALSVLFVGDTSGDRIYLVECSLLNTFNGSSARCCTLDNNCIVINCDFECSGAAHSRVLDMDNQCVIINCRIIGSQSGIAMCRINEGVVIGTLFKGTGGNGIGLNYGNNPDDSQCLVGCTFQNLARGFDLPNAVTPDVFTVVNNHCTDCGEWINSLFSPTADLVMLEVNTRTRDNTTPRTGIGDGLNIGEVTTDTGGEGTDYTDAPNDDMTLIDGAPGVETGARAHTDIGAYQRAAGAGGANVTPPSLHAIESGIATG